MFVYFIQLRGEPFQVAKKPKIWLPVTDVAKKKMKSEKEKKVYKVLYTCTYRPLRFDLTNSLDDGCIGVYLYSIKIGWPVKWKEVEAVVFVRKWEANFSSAAAASHPSGSPVFCIPIYVLYMYIQRGERDRYIQFIYSRLSMLAGECIRKDGF